MTQSGLPEGPEDDPQGPVLVAGGAGYIGSHTVRELVSRGIEVVILDDLSTGHRESVPEGVPLVEASIGDRAAVREALAQYRPKAVIHFAAKCYVGVSVTDPATYYEENVIHTWSLLEELRAAEVKTIVFSSTCATYGDPVTVPMTEDHQQVPINPYGHTKLHIEHMLGDYGRAYGLRAAALRYFNAAGAATDGSVGEDHDPETHLIPLVLQVAQGRRESISIFGEDYPTRDGSCIRDYIHVEDLADAHLRALALLQSSEAGHQLRCNLGTGSGYSVKEVIEAARTITGHPIPAVVAPRREGDPPELVSGGTRAKDVLGWAPRKAGLERILEDAWRFHQGHPRGY
tara:strand:- start:11167 stop:12201 length:1035 start_codon:yes stop_codon:yes gene_type:complete